jgi:ATP-binding cassette, subfamily C (CFTR/MRP), member 1
MSEIGSPWKYEVESSSTGMPRLGLVLLEAYWKPILYSTLSFSLFVGCSLAQPFLVAAILNYVETGSASFFGVNSGIGIALIMGIVSLFGAFGFNLGWYYISHFSLRVKTTLLTLIYDKSLTISTAARQRFTTGEIMTLLSVDVERIWNALGLACWYWIVPIMCSVGIGLLYVELGVSALYCGTTLLMWSAFQHKVGVMVGNIRLELVKHTAERVNLTKEVLQGVRLVKLYAWETPIEQSITTIRATEILLLSKYQQLKMLSTVSLAISPL